MFRASLFVHCPFYKLLNALVSSLNIFRVSVSYHNSYASFYRNLVTNVKTVFSPFSPIIFNIHSILCPSPHIVPFSRSLLSRHLCPASSASEWRTITGTTPQETSCQNSPPVKFITYAILSQSLVHEINLSRVHPTNGGACVFTIYWNDTRSQSCVFSGRDSSL